MEDDKVKWELTPEEVTLIAYWRECCHLYNNYCPLHCLKDEGTDFCKALTKKIHDVIKKQNETR